MKFWICITLSLVNLLGFTCAQSCFGGTLVYEKVTGASLVGLTSTTLLQQENAAITAECQASCKASSTCFSFSVDYESSTCVAYDRNSDGRREMLADSPGTNYFEKVCLTGALDYERLCGVQRLWAFERTVGAFLDGFDNKTIPNVNSRAECHKLCLTETDFLCRSADFDTRGRQCRLSAEDRRSQPNAFVERTGSGIDYLENQCAGTLPECRYETQENVMVATMDELEFANSQDDCAQLCDSAREFTCRSYTYDDGEKRCYLSGDDSISLRRAALPPKNNVLTGERQCFISECDTEQGTVIYEKVSRTVLRSSREVELDVDTSATGITEQCSIACRDEGPACPSFSVDYENNRCYRLDRNSQGRANELTEVTGRNYFEKTCVRVPLLRSCSRKGWHFERVPGKTIRTPSDRTIRRVETRRDCIEHCFLETNFLCRSAVYDSTSLDCELRQIDRRRAGGAYVDGGANVEYLENQCPPVDGSCRYAQVEDSYPRYLDATIKGISSEEQCGFRCTNYQGFNCRSFAYYSTGSECFLSGDDRVSTSSAEAVASRTGTSYYDRVCPPGVTSPGNTGIGSGVDLGGIGGFGTGSSGGGFGLGTGSGFGFSAGGSGSGFSPGLGGAGFGIGSGSPGTGSGTGSSGSGFGLGTGGSGSGFGIGSGNQGGGGGGLRPNTGLFPSGVPLPGVNTGSGGTGVRPGETPSRPGGIPSRPGEILNRPGGIPSRPGGIPSRPGGIPNRPFGTPIRPGNRPTIPDGRCRVGRRTYEKVNGFELRNVRAYPLSSATKPGITRECLEKCNTDRECKATNIDHNRYECKGLERQASRQPVDLRSFTGIDHFEAVCLIGRTCGLLWTFERVPDYQIPGIPKETFPDVTKDECMDLCLDSRKYECRSANYEYINRLCKLYDKDRYSSAQPLLNTLNVDYFENQCATPLTECAFRNRETDKFLVYVTKTVSVFNEADCEKACSTERDFNCRSFSFLAQNNIRSDQCLLSSVSGSLAGASAFVVQRGAIYAEKICRGFPSGGSPGIPTGGGFVASEIPNNLPGRRPSSRPGLRPGGRPGIRPGNNAFSGREGIDECPVPLTYEKISGMDFTFARKQEIIPRETFGITIDCLQVCQRERTRCLGVTVQTTRSSGQRCYTLNQVAGTRSQRLTPNTEVSYFEKVCIPERGCGKTWAFTRVPGYDLDVESTVLTNIRSRKFCQAACLRAVGLPCRSAVYNSNDATCKLMADTRRTQQNSFKFVSQNIDYLENQCAPEPPNCEYTNYEGQFLPHLDRYIRNVIDRNECQSYCDRESDFTCRSYNYQAKGKECSLSSDDIGTLGGTSALSSDRNYFYADKAVCRNARIDCTSSSMVVTFMFTKPFDGRIFAKGNPQVCFEVGNGDQEVVLRIPLDTSCGTTQVNEGRYVNNVILQEHPIIMQDSDRSIRVECSFDAADKTVSFGPSLGSGRLGGGIDITNNIRPPQGRRVTDVLKNTAPTPRVGMSIYKVNGAVANNVQLGEALELRVEILEPSAFGIFVRNLEARTEFGELMTLIDNSGCPRYPQIFSALEIDEISKSVIGYFKAFRFPSTGKVNFVATIRFCQDFCQPANCGGGLLSFGKKRKRRSLTKENSTHFNESDNNDKDNEIEKSGNSKNKEIILDLNKLKNINSSQIDENEIETEVVLNFNSAKNINSEEMIIAEGNSATNYTSKTSNLSPFNPYALDEPSLVNASTDAKKLTKHTEDIKIPNDIPITLSLIVGEGEPNKDSFKSIQKEEYIEKDYICSSTSSVIASIAISLLLILAAIAAFTVFYLSKKRNWQKMFDDDVRFPSQKGKSHL